MSPKIEIQANRAPRHNEYRPVRQICVKIAAQSIHTCTLMNPVVPGMLAALLYIAGAGIQYQTHSKAGLIIVGSLAILLHGIATYLVFNTDAGFDLGLYTMLSLSMLAVTTIVMLSSLHRPVDNLFIIIFPFAAITIVLEMFLEGTYVPRTEISSGIAVHITLSIIAYALLTVAAIQAAALSFGDYEMKHHRLEIMKRLPPLETMDALLFELLGAGLAFLTLAIVSGFFFLEDIWGPGLIHHTVLTFAAWLVFMVLLFGRIKLGWRGAVASRWTLSGFALLVLGYFGSKLVIEVILGV
jgi:ABC-type uncharacterized transport system permease subunit